MNAKQISQVAFDLELMLENFDNEYHKMRKRLLQLVVELDNHKFKQEKKQEKERKLK